MAPDRELFLQKIRDSYEFYYDITPADEQLDLPLCFTAEFHARDEGYVLVKSAKTWAMESNEYVYVFSVPVLDEELAKRCIDFALEDGVPRITPHREHKESYIIAVFLADVIEPGAAQHIRRRKYDKSFRFGLDGWSALRTAGVELQKELVMTNRAGVSLTKLFRKLLRSEK